MNRKLIHRIYGILLSVFIVISGLLLIAECIGIYQSGARPFTPESVSAAFTSIALPVYISLCLVLGGLILDCVCPGPKTKIAPEKNFPLILQKLYDKHGSITTPEICAEQRRRRLRHKLALGLIFLCTIALLSYSLCSANFDSTDINCSVLKAALVLLLGVVILFSFSIYTIYYDRASLKREISLVKEAVAKGCSAAAVAPKKASLPSLAGLRWALLAFGIFLLLYGFFTGGTQDVLTKAVNICTECVGLG